jgi:hypothetical protein
VPTDAVRLSSTQASARQDADMLRR